MASLASTWHTLPVTVSVAATHATHASSEQEIHERLGVRLDSFIELRLAGLEHLHEFLVELGTLKNSGSEFLEARVGCESLKRVTKVRGSFVFFISIFLIHHSSVHAGHLTKATHACTSSCAGKSGGKVFKGTVGIPEGCLQSSSGMLLRCTRDHHKFV